MSQAVFAHRHRPSAARIVLAAILATFGATTLHATCPEGRSVPITSGGRGTAPVVFSGLGPRVEAAFFILGRADTEWSAGLPATAWVVPAGDVDVDGIEDYRIEVPGLGPGGWGDPLAAGCPATTDPPLTPLAIVLRHEREDLDGDGKFDVFEDQNGNDVLDPGEDRDNDGRLTLSGRGPYTGGCEGVTREDIDCDGYLDRINEDFNHNGRLDAGEDLDGDTRWDNINEDRDGDGKISVYDKDGDGLIEFEDGDRTEDTNGNGFLDGKGSYTEDRNNDGGLNDRPAPGPADVILDVALDGTTRRLPPHYPYGGFHPTPGGVVLGSVAWDDDAYDFSAITTPALPGNGGEDPDGDGAFDVFEDRNRDGRLDAGEDLDGDGRLTPAGGCEGRLREDVDCDGVLDRINEDFNANGLFDPGEDLDGDGRFDRIEEDLDRDGNLDPGEDTNLNGRLDHGDKIEDRNRNQILDDRPFPDSGDVIMEHRPDGTAARISSTYPYGTFTPTGAVRVVRASSVEGLAPGASGAHLDPQGLWRVQLKTDGVGLVDEVGGTRAVIVEVSHALRGPIFFPYGADAVSAPEASYFVETGGSGILVPAAGNGASGVFVSIVPEISDAPSPLEERPPAVWTDLRVATTSGTLRLPMPPAMRAIVDVESDRIPIPEDNCPAVANTTQADADADGVGDVCDPGEDPRPVVPDRWEVITPDGGPGHRVSVAAAFDEARGVVVLYGGSVLDASTWEFDGTSWRRIVTPTAPGARTGHRMVYDGVRRRILLFGGVRAADGSLSDELWQYDGADWSRVPAGQSPSPRRNAGLAFDAGRDRLVLFGGEESGRALADTWEFSASSWRRIPTPRVPAARAGHQMVYDPFRRLVVMQGGRASSSGNDRNDTWGYDGETWLPIDHTGEIPTTTGGTMAFDPDRRQAVVTGGDADAWTDPAGPRAILTASTRLFDGVAWSTLATLDTLAARRNHAAAFDTVRGLLVVQGGSGAGGSLSDTTVLRRASDSDGDGVSDRMDNCPLAANPEQDDADGDSSGDRCDNCPQTPNQAQRDRDSDRLGDACDVDLDGDGVANDADVCPGAYVAGRPFAAVLQGGGPDSDGDGTADDCDRCPLDAGDDADQDGVCGDADNCPQAFNPRQEDGTADGYGDACQTTVRVFPVRPLGGNGLTTRVFLGSPDGDPLAGIVAIRGTVSVPDVLADLGQGCALAYLPDGVPGEGIVYAAHPDTPVLGDADSNLGCADGLADYELALGTCEEAAAEPGAFTTLLTIKTTVPHPICLRGIGGTAEGRDYTVWRVSASEVVLASPVSPLIEEPYQDTRLPNSVSLGRLPGPGLYVLRVTAADGTTPEASDEVLFARDRENSLHLVQRWDRRADGS